MMNLRTLHVEYVLDWWAMALDHAHEQGVTRRRLSCEELFPKEVSFEVRI